MLQADRVLYEDLEDENTPVILTLRQFQRALDNARAEGYQQGIYDYQDKIKACFHGGMPDIGISEGNLEL